MRCRLGSLSAVLMIILISVTGCASSQKNRVGFYATSETDFSKSSPPSLQTFSKGEIVVLVLEGYGGETYEVKVLDTSTNQVADKREGSLPPGAKYGLLFQGLPVGSYVAELYVDGTLLRNWMFSVHTQPVRQ
jgi:hypothetical protein